MKFGFKGFVGFNSGLLLHGYRGTGKSGVLAFATMWAHQNNWLVVSVPSAFRLTQTKTLFDRHHKTGLYLQNDLAKEWLGNFRNANKTLLATININKDLYGKFNYSGVHDNEPEPVPNTFYKRRKAYFKDHEKFLYPEEIRMMDESDKKMEIRVSDKLKNPKTLLELVDYGIANEWFACNVVHELLE
jgi:small subunit ribosomal protein S29